MVLDDRAGLIPWLTLCLGTPTHALARFEDALGVGACSFTWLDQDSPVVGMSAEPFSPGAASELGGQGASERAGRTRDTAGSRGRNPVVLTVRRGRAGGW